MSIVKSEDHKHLTMPEQNISLDIEKIYTAEEFEKIRAGSLPKESEDKWFIYFKDNVLYIHRNWTGACIFQIEFNIENNTVTSVVVNRDEEEYISGSDENDKELALYLIDHILLNKNVPFPYPDTIDDDIRDVYFHQMMGDDRIDDAF